MSRAEQCRDNEPSSGAQDVRLGIGAGVADGGGGGGVDGDGDGVGGGGGGGLFQVLRNWETPAAYRSRLRLAFVLVVLGLGARYMNGGRLPLEKLFNHAYYSWGNANGGTYAVVVGPNLGLVLLSIVLRFMMARPQVGVHDEEPPPPPPPPPAAPPTATTNAENSQHAHDE